MNGTPKIQKKSGTKRKKLFYLKKMLERVLPFLRIITCSCIGCKTDARNISKKSHKSSNNKLI